MVNYKITYTQNNKEVVRYYNSEKSAHKKYYSSLHKNPVCEEKIRNNNGTYFWSAQEMGD